MDYSIKLSTEFGIRQDYAKNIITLIDEENTIPFIARYRKEMTGSCDDQVLRDFADRLKYLRNLDKRKQEVADSITEQGKMTDEIMIALASAITTMTDSIFSAQNKAELARLQAQQNSLDMRKGSLETQLKSLEGQYQAAEQAESDSAKSLAPKFAVA